MRSETIAKHEHPSGTGSRRLQRAAHAAGDRDHRLCRLARQSARHRCRTHPEAGRYRIRPTPGQAGGGLCCRVFARQDRAHQCPVFCRSRPASAALGRRPHHHVPDRIVCQRGRGAQPVPVADRDTPPQRIAGAPQAHADRMVPGAARPHRFPPTAGKPEEAHRDQGDAGGGSDRARTVERRG